MATKGSLYLDNEVLIRLHDQTKTYQTTVQDAFYAEYKTAFKISKSNHFRGDAADAFKNYVANGTVNIISGFLDLSSDLTMISQLLAETFYQYENSHSGRVEEAALDYIISTLNSKELTYEDARSELNEVMNLASQYIKTTKLSLDTVNTGYTNTRDALKKIREDMYTVDDEALAAVSEVLGRIEELHNLIKQMMSFCYHDDGSINANNLPKLQNQPWFQTTGNVTLYLMMQEDPFEYCAGEVTLSEDQWAAGLCSDIYAYAGYSFLSASGEAGVEDGTAFAKGKAAVLQANGYAQFTDYLRASAKLNVLYAEGDAKIGFSEDYMGFKVDAEVGVINVEGSVILGTDEVNAFVKGDAKVLCADGKAAFEFEDDGEFAIGVDGSATLASASVKGGVSILSFKNKDTATGETESLLGFKVGAKASAGGSFALWAESETAIEMEYMNINATTVKIDAAVLLGIDLSITVPTPYFKKPW